MSEIVRNTFESCLTLESEFEQAQLILKDCVGIGYISLCTLLLQCVGVFRGVVLNAVFVRSSWPMRS